MRINDNLFIAWNNPEIEMTIGIHMDTVFSGLDDEDDLEDEDDILITSNRLILGLFLFNITFIY